MAFALVKHKLLFCFSKDLCRALIYSYCNRYKFRRLRCRMALEFRQVRGGRKDRGDNRCKFCTLESSELSSKCKFRFVDRELRVREFRMSSDRVRHCLLHSSSKPHTKPLRREPHSHFRGYSRYNALRRTSTSHMGDSIRSTYRCWRYCLGTRRERFLSQVQQHRERHGKCRLMRMLQTE